MGDRRCRSRCADDVVGWTCSDCVDPERRCDFVLYGLREDSRNSAGGDKMTQGGLLLGLVFFRIVAYNDPSTGPCKCCCCCCVLPNEFPSNELIEEKEKTRMEDEFVEESKSDAPHQFLCSHSIC